MFGVEAAWCLDINGDDDFKEEFRSIKIIETSDLALPFCNLMFKTTDWDKVKQYTDPGYDVSIGMGRESIETTSKFTVFKKQVRTFGGNNQWMVNLYMTYNSMDYYTKHLMNIYNSTSDLQNSSDVISTVASRNSLTPDVETSKDKMMWIQSNTSDRRFLEEVCTHSYFEDNNPALYAARRDGKFLFKPAKSFLKKKFTFGQGEVDIKIDTQQIHNRDGFFGSWLGKTRIIPFHDWEGGTTDQETSTTEEIINSSVGMDDFTKFAAHSTINDNVHKNWLKAQGQNLQCRSSISAASMEIVQAEGVYIDAYVLDCLEGNFTHTETNEAITPFMGLWLSTKVAHQILDGHYSCNITVAREGLQ